MKRPARITGDIAFSREATNITKFYILKEYGHLLYRLAPLWITSSAPGQNKKPTNYLRAFLLKSYRIIS